MKVLFTGKVFRSRALLALVAFVIFLGFGGFGASARAEVVDRIVAVVNDDIITLSELDSAAKISLGGLKGDRLEDLLVGMDEVDTVSRILDAMIEKTLMRQSAERVGIEVSDQEIDNAIEDVIADNNIDRDQLMSYLSDNDLTYKEYREQIKEDIREVKFTDRYFRSRVVLSEEALEELYHRNIDDFRGAQSYRLKLIILSPKEGEVGVDERRISALKDALEGGDFDGVVAEFSDGPAKDRGGDIGYVKSGDVDSLIESAVLKLSAGEVSPLLEVGDNIYVVKLVDSKAGEVASFEEVSNILKQSLFKTLLKERYEEWLGNTRKFAHIEVRL